MDMQDAARHFATVLDRVRRQGLTDDVASLESWIPRAEDPALRAQMAKLLGFFHLRRGDLDDAVRWCDIASEGLPDDPDATYNAIFARFQQGAWEESAERLRAALRRHGDRIDFRNLLAAALGALGNLSESRLHGTRTLELKEQQATAPPHDLSGVPVPPFRPDRNIVAFSLYGSALKYTDGALLNVRAARFVYPGWMCRFYADASVPAAVLDALAGEGAQIAMVRGMPSDPYGTFWRFLVADDPDVDRYIVRDADSLLNIRERVAVDEWLDSGRHFHVMRDHFDHSELVMAGMWGGVRGALPPISPAIQSWFPTRRTVLGGPMDQEFLRAVCWPTIRQSVMAHDSQFAFGEHRDFPAVGRLPPGCWVGCDWQRMVAPPL